ncbi:MAG: type 1 glutamine amidotransferase [Bacteroidales bacterium]|nr:type 1 glutamine amidotransferase [Bacteroidales bacterium]
MRIHFFIHVPVEEPALILDWVNDSGHSKSFTRFYKDPSLPDINDFDALIIMGGAMSVNDEERYPWLKAEKQFIKKCIDSNKKVLGVCLGSQLIAAALGSKIYKNTYSEIGWFNVWLLKVNNEKSPFANLPGRFCTFHWHGDTFDLPAGCTRYASSEVTPNQAFMYKDIALALQFHMEFDAKTIKEMIQAWPEDFDGSKYVQDSEFIINNLHRIEDNRKYLNTILEDFFKS